MVQTRRKSAAQSTGEDAAAPPPKAVQPRRKSAAQSTGGGGDVRKGKTNPAEKVEGQGAGDAQQPRPGGAEPEAKEKETPSLVKMQWGKLAAVAYPERHYIGLGCLTLLITSGMNLLFIRVIGDMIDAIPAHLKDVDQGWEPLCEHVALRRTVLQLFGVFMLGGLMTSVRDGLFTLVSERVAARLRKTLFAHVVALDVGFFDGSRTADIVSRLQVDCGILQMTCSYDIMHVLRNLVQLVGSVAIVFAINWKMTLMLLSVVPVLAVAGEKYNQWLTALTIGLQDAVAESSVVADENLSSIRTVRALSGERIARGRYDAQIDKSYALAVTRGGVYALSTGGVHILTNFVLSGVLYYGASLVLQGESSVGALLSFVMYGFSIAFSFEDLTRNYNDLLKSVGSGHKVFKLLETPAGIPLQGEGELVRSVGGQIEFRGVDFTYPTRPEAQVLHAVSIDIRAGQTVALVGPSGCGKSTVVHLINRLYDPSKGTVLVDGKDLRSLDRHTYMKHVASVMQEPVLFAASIRENILYGFEPESHVTPTELEELIKDAATHANAWGFIVKSPDGLDTLVGERGARLSGGQKQRIAIARALIRRPSVLLLDEATSALDSESEAQVQAAIDSLLREHCRTTVVIAHRLSTVRDADNIVVLNGGKVVQQGKHEELFGKDGNYRQLVSKQIH